MTKFDDFSKGPNDLLNDDYTTKTTLKCKKAAGPVAVTIESDRSKEGSIASKVGLKASYAGLSFDKIQFKPCGAYALETSMVPYAGTKMTFKGAKGAVLGLDYAKGNLLASGSMDVKDMSNVSASASLGLAEGIKLGGSATYGLKGAAGLTAFNVGATYAKGPLYTSLITASKISQVNAGVLYKVNNTLTLASVSSHSKAKPLEAITVGGSYQASFGNVKAKVNNDGILSACLVKDVAPKVSVTLSGTAPASDISNIKYGIGIVM